MRDNSDVDIGVFITITMQLLIINSSLTILFNEWIHPMIIIIIFCMQFLIN